MASNFANAGFYLIQTLFGIYIIVIILRFLMQLLRVDFYNPISQAVVKLTDPLVKPMRRLIPSVRGVDISTLILAVAFEMLAMILLVTLTGFTSPGIIKMISWSVLALMAHVLDIYWFSLLAVAIASFFASSVSQNPALTVLHQLTEPICAPARRLIPPIGGLDISFLFVFMFITLIDKFFLIEPLKIVLGYAPRYENLILGL